MIEEFLEDPNAWDMYITGAAGTGKTTSLAKSIQYCMDNKIPYVTCAYTHKACGILRSKLPDGAKVQTLHSFLKKRPMINTEATKIKHVNINTKTGDIEERPHVMFIDEYSMIGEKDLMDIREAQDPDYDGGPNMKVVWIGDMHQLPPVGDQQTLNPSGKYCQTLTKQYRNDNPLQEPLTALISYLEGATPKPLKAVEGYFERGLDLVKAYLDAPTKDRVILAYTNERVQGLNRQISGRSEPEYGDILFSPTTQQSYEFVAWIDPYEVSYIDLNWSDPLALNSKYKTLENLIDTGLCKFAKVFDEEGEELIFAVVFGHYDYKVEKERLEKAAVESNQEIEKQFRGYKAAGWSRANPKHKLARRRAKAWRDCLSFKDCVICLDFPYAMTVHKSQGSTYQNVYIDSDDIAKCADYNFELYLKLMYVAISRASNYVGTN